MKDLEEQDKIHSIVENVFDETGSLNSEDKEGVLLKLETHHDNFVKVLTYTGFLLEQIKTKKSDLKHESQQKAIAVDKQVKL